MLMQEHVFLPSYKKKKMENIILTHFINFTKSYKNIYKKKKNILRSNITLVKEILSFRGNLKNLILLKIFLHMKIYFCVY